MYMCDSAKKKYGMCVVCDLCVALVGPRARAAHATAREAAGPLALAIPKRAAFAVDYVARQKRTEN